MRIRIILPGLLISCLLGNPVAVAQQLSLEDLDARVLRHIIADFSGNFQSRGWLASIEAGEGIGIGEVSSATLNPDAVVDLIQSTLENGVVRNDAAGEARLRELINNMAQYGQSSNLGNERNIARYELNLEFELNRYFFWNRYFGNLEFSDSSTGTDRQMPINGWAVTRITYVTVLILMSALAAGLLWQSYRLQTGWTLAMHARESGRPLQGLATVEELHSLHSGWPSLVKLKQQLQEQVNHANLAFNQALAAIRDGQIEMAGNHLKQSLDHNKEHEQAQDHLRRLDDIGQAWSLMREADSLKQENPDQAITLYARARKLNPDLAPQLAARKAMVEMETAIGQFNNEGLESNEKFINEKLTGVSGQDKDIYELVAELDDAIMQLEDNDPSRLSLQNRRDAVTSAMQCPPQVELEGPWGKLKLTRVESLLLGRAVGKSSGPDGNDIAVRHRRVSRRQLEIICQNNGFAMQDLGSSNGTLVNGLSLEPDRFLVIPEQGGMVAMGGRKNPVERGTCRYLLQTTQHQPCSLLIGIDPNLRRNPEVETGIDLWTSLERDARIFHLMIRGKVQLTTNPDKPVVVSKEDVSEACVMLEPTARGYNLVPTGDIAVKINQARIRQSTPLLANAVFEAGGLTCKLVIGKTSG